MATLLIPTNPGESFAFAQEVTLDQVTVRLAFRWFPVPARWSMQVQTPDGIELAPESMVSPGGEVYVDTRDPRCPPGQLLWTGPDPYGRDELGQTVQLVYIEAADLE